MAAIWTPSDEDVSALAITRFRLKASELAGRDLADYEALYQWSLQDLESFWSLVWDFCGVLAETRGERVLMGADQMPGAAWFPDARLNFAQNLLRRNDNDLALIFRGEDEVEAEITWCELQQLVSQTQQLLRDAGVVAGDRVAAYIPNMPEAVVAMLATASLGAVWTSCAPEFGVEGTVDRFSQTAPKVLFIADGYFYNGKSFDSLEKSAQIIEQLPSVEQVFICTYLQDEPQIPHSLMHAVLYPHAVAQYSAKPVQYTMMPFNSPLYVMYSSGTTGVPKCIVHGAGGVLLQHLKEHVLHIGLKRDERIFYSTTCGWMMWNWLVSALAVEATLVLYDGSPFYPDGNALFDLAADTGVNVLGISAKLIDIAQRQGIKPARDSDLSSVRMVLSTGSALSAESYDYVYTHIKDDVCLGSIAGGTDILSNFALANPALPVHRGEIQCRGLGMAVEVWSDLGLELEQGKGELVCSKPFPSMPLGFWNDDGNGKYHDTYFSQFEGVWAQGDFVELTANKGLRYFGRSDSTLNPGGVRIGTAEIYRQLAHFEGIEESIVIGQDWENDSRIVLFVKLAEELKLDEALSARIKQHIRAKTTSQHVPAKIVQVSEIPLTTSGKIVERLVRDVVHGVAIGNTDAIANPEALGEFANRVELLSA